MRTRRDEVCDEGFTLLELLVVIVILGILSTVVIFAVQGVVDRGEVSALEGDARTLQSAEESHYAMHGAYADEAGLVAGGFLRSESRLHDVTVASDGESYSIGTEGSAPAATTTTVAGGPGDPDPDVTTTTVATGPVEPDPDLPGPGEPGGPPLSAESWGYAGQTGWSYGDTTSSKKLVIIGNGSGAAGQALWQSITAAGTALAVDTQVIWMESVASRADVDAILAATPTYVIVPIQVNLAGGGYAGQYISTSYHWASPEQYWWGQQQGGVNGAIDYYLAHF